MKIKIKDIWESWFKIWYSHDHESEYIEVEADPIDYKFIQCFNTEWKQYVYEHRVKEGDSLSQFCVACGKMFAPQSPLIEELKPYISTPASEHNFPFEATDAINSLIRAVNLLRK